MHIDDFFGFVSFNTVLVNLFFQISQRKLVDHGYADIVVLTLYFVRVFEVSEGCSQVWMVLFIGQVREVRFH